MNDAFVTNRNKVAASPVLQAISKMPENNDVVDQMFLTFLSRLPTNTERQIAVNALKQTTTIAQRNTAIEDLAWVLINKGDFIFSY